jgi:hypothetical protein
MKIPAHVAAYAAGLHTAGGVSWLDVAELLERAGLGSYGLRELARQALAWQRTNIDAAAVRAARRWRKRQHTP